MTHAAAATRTLRSPRRRPDGPAAGERAGAVSGVVGAGAVVVAMCVLSLTPSVDSTPAVVRAHLGGHSPVTMAAAYAIVVAALLLVPFLASLRTFTVRRVDVARWRRTVTLVAGAIGVVMVALAGALLATATLLANRSTADEAVFAVFVAGKLVATLAVLPVAGLVLANARSIATTQRRPERWLIRFDIEIAIIAVVASVASFVDHDWLAPGGPVVAGAWFLVAVWVVALARTIVRGADVTFSEEDS
jgi:hypothetical protein